MAREIPSRFAICVLGIPSAGKTSSRSSSPGWVGFRPARREFPLISDNPPGPHRSHRQTESVTASEFVENPDLDRKSTRLKYVTNAQLFCRLLLEKKQKLDHQHYSNKVPYTM